MSWYRGIAPAYLGFFAWPPFFDQLWGGDISRHDAARLIGTTILGSVACFALYFLAASIGFRARRPLVVVAASTFGTVGSEWLCGVAVAVASVVWYAVAVNFAVDSTMQGLRACGLIPPSGLAGFAVGSLVVKSPVFLGTALFWIYITRLAILMRLPGVVVALMKVYSPVALLLLTATALWRWPLLASGSHMAGQELIRFARTSTSPPGQDSALQMIIGFFAMVGLLSVDWGAAVRERRDILRAGMPSVLVAAAWTSITSLIVVLETAHRIESRGQAITINPGDPVPFSFRWGVFQGGETFPAGMAAAILILFGLAALAPAVASLERMSDGLITHWSRLTQRRATLFGCAIAFVLMATAQVDRLGPIAGAMGAIFAPALGAIAGQGLGRGSSSGVIRPGINPAGVLAWIAGFALALVLEIAKSIYPDLPDWLQATALLGLLTAAIASWVFARLGLESPPAEPGPTKLEA
jgi:cytosine permease